MEELYAKYQQHPRICTDSRNIIPDSLFICLKGERFDGNQFVLQALEKGAAYVITEDRKWQDHAQCIVVEDALTTLQQLSLHHRKTLNIPIIGVTGTNGKTTTKELIHAVLSTQFKTACTKGNLNNHIGVPLTLLSIPTDAEIAIVEMGANHPGEIEFLCNLALPTCGLITNIGKAHIEGFGSVEAIIHTKKALYRSVIQQEGTLFVNINDPILCHQLEYSKIVYYAEGGEQNILGMSPYLRIRVAGHEVETHLTGSYNLYNFLAAASIGQFFGVDDTLIAQALAQYMPTNHRSQIITQGSNTIICDYYNANPTSMEAALRNLSQIDHPQKLAILGDMLELGAISREEHQHILRLCQELHLQALFVGSEFSALQPVHSFPDVERLNHHLRENPVRDTLILVKGSNGIHLDKLSAILP